MTTPYHKKPAPKIVGATHKVVVSKPAQGQAMAPIGVVGGKSALDVPAPSLVGRPKPGQSIDDGKS